MSEQRDFAFTFNTCTKALVIVTRPRSPHNASKLAEDSSGEKARLARGLVGEVYVVCVEVCGFVCDEAPGVNHWNTATSEERHRFSVDLSELPMPAVDKLAAFSINGWVGGAENDEPRKIDPYRVEEVLALEVCRVV